MEAVTNTFVSGVDGVVQEYIQRALAARAGGDLRAARMAVEQALEMRPEGNQFGQALFLHGAFLREMGEYCGAVDRFREFLGGLDNYPELAPVAEGSAWHNLGLALRCCRDLEVAREAYAQAVACHRREGMEKLLRESLQNLAWTHCLMGDAAGAQGALAESDPMCDTAEAQDRQTLGMAHLALIEGRYSSVFHLCEPLVQTAKHVLPDVTSHAYWLCGRAALILGEAEKAAVFAGLARDLGARDRTDSRCLSDASALLSEIRQARPVIDTTLGGM